jgi:hypothetical protein
MVVLNDVVHFRGEVVTLYATFKAPTGVSAGTDLVPFSPAVRIEFANPLGQLQEILPTTPMSRISIERYFFNWTIPNDAPLTTYNAVMSGVLEDKEVIGTQEIIVGNPALTVKSSFLRYGPTSSFIQSPRTSEPRLHPQLPQGTF